MKRYKFHDGIFTFWVAEYGSQFNDAQLVFRVREDAEPKARADQKGIKYYNRIVPAFEWQIQHWMLDHPDFPLQETFE